MSARSGDMERSLFTVCALILVLGVAVHSASGSSRPKGKPGVCPSFRWSGTLRPCRNACSNDRQCPGPSKCCRLGCGRVCLVPNGVKPGVCPSTGWSSLARPCQVKCTKDYQCPGKCKCCRQGCHRLCREPVIRIKPGSCPRVNWSGVGRPCRNRCSQDSQCPGRQKCCRVRCGRRCVRPTVIRFIKPGRCPPFKWSNVGTRCPNLCSQDSQCRGRQKCCRVGCGRRCVRPTVIKIKPGSCPPVNWSRVGRPCANLCSQDSNCPGRQKCCNAGCGRRCLVPLVPGGNGENWSG